MRPFPFPLLALAFLALSVSAAYIEPDVGNEIAKNGIAPVIVVLSEGPVGLGGGKREGKALVLDRLQDYVAAKLAGSEGPQFRQVARLQSGAFAAMKAEKVGRHVQAKRRFSSLPSFSADVDADGLRHLQRNRWVESVWFDRPVFADTAVSIPQINADDVQNYVRSGTNFTGHNQTICILDTGIDYTHEAFGACGSPVNGTSVDANVSWLNESAHPYSNSANTTVTFNSTAMGLGTYSRMAVHFANISLEPNYDHLFVEDSSGRVLASYSGNRTSFWSPSAEGDTVVLRLVSDANVTAYGFSVDLVNNGTTTADANWVCPKVAGGYDFVNNDFDPMDDASNSHGTHVSGIAAGNGTIRGVAPHARIASVKVLNSAGSGTSSDIVAGIDWCNTNRFTYNISVLSMSLGTVAVSSSYCDSVATSLAVQRAFGSGVFVSAASGNSGSSSGVSSPACSSNATAVGAVNSADGIASFSNTWANFMVLAPGNEVVSSTRNNNTASLPGTSMAAPHVAGAAALMQEFAQRANGSLAAPLYIRNLLNRTGVPVLDTRVSSYYSRIDVLSALNAFLAEVTPRNITIESFTNASVANNGYAFVNVSFFDDNLTPSSCILQWSNGSVSNVSMAIASGSCSYNATGQSNVNASFRVYLNDSYNNVGTAFFTRSLDTLAPQQVSSSFSNNSVLGDTSVQINATFSDLNPHSCILELNGSNSSTAAGASGCSFTSAVANGTYNFTVYVNDSLGRYNNSGRYFFTIDSFPPASLALASPTLANNTNSTGSDVYVNLTFTEANPSNCILQFNNTNYTMSTSFGGNTAANRYCYYDVATLANGLNNYTAFVNDSAGNIVATGPYYVRLDSAYPTHLASAAGNLPNNSNTSSSTIVVNYTFIESIPANCTLEFNNGTAVNYTMTLNVNSTGGYCNYSLVTRLAVSGMDANYTVFVGDGAGQVNASALRVVRYDATAPVSLALASPTLANNTNSTGSDVYVNLTFTEANPSNCILQFNNTNYTMTASFGGVNPASRYCYYDVTTLANGLNNYTAFVNDSAGNIVATGPYYVRLDSVYPTHLGFAGPTHSANNSNTSSDFVYVNLTYIETTPANCTLQFNNGTLANYSMSLTQNSSGGYCYYNVSSAFSTSGMIANYTVFVGDGAGQVNASALRVVRYDATAPASLALNTTGRNLANNSNFTGDFAYVNVTFSELNANNCVLQFNNTNYTMTASFGGVNPANRYCYYNMSTLANGLNNYTVFVNDTSGNIAATGPYYVRLDSAYPSALSVVFPTLANNSNTTLNYAYFNFTFSEANPANCTLEFNNGTAANYSMQLAGSGSGAYCYYNVTSAFSVSGMGANYTAYVFDGSGNSNATALRYVNFDNTAPSSILLVSPTFANGTYNTTDYIYANLSFTESSPSACTLQFNGTVNYSMALAGSGPSLYCHYNVTSLAEGVHNFAVFVNDTAGNSAASFRVITLDRTAPAISAVSASPSAINASLSFTISANASDSISSVLNITLALTNSSGTQNYSTRASKSGINYTFSFTSLALQDGNYTVNVSAWDNASNYASNASLNITFDSTPPSVALLSGEANSSGVISLNWSAGLDAASFGHFELYRNGSRLSSSTGRNYTDSSAVYSAFYNYTMYAFDSVGNVNASNSAYVSANDTTYPRYTANLTATNLANGTVNLSWSNVTLDTSGQAERNATFFVYRTANTSSTNASNMTLLANTTLLYYSDSSALSASYSYLYAVATLDGNGNLNSTVAANNSVNQTTVSTCSNSFNDWSACSGGSQSRTRTCLGAAQTEAQSCSSGGASSTGSVTSAPVAGGAVSGGSGGVSTGGARGGGGGSAGKGNQLFVIAEVPKAVEMKPGAEATMPVVISSFYTGFLNYVNVTLEGVPGDWYEVKPVKYVTPISNTSFDIVWRIPEEARGNYSVQVVLSGLGSKTLGILNTSYNFTLVLPPVKSLKPVSGAPTGKAADVGAVPSVAPPLAPVRPAQTDYSQYYAVVGMLALSAMVFGAYELGRWKESPE